jgi:hypothetical protein
VGAIQLMQATPLKVGRIADVVQVGCGDQVATILLAQDRAHFAGALANGSDVIPSVAERGKQTVSLGSRPLFKHHR